jgi:quercetin dioxygenase-like cupin family protein
MFVLDGEVEVTVGCEMATLHADDFAYVPAHLQSSVRSSTGAGVLLFERRYALQGKPAFVHGHTQEQSVLPTEGEVFALRKLLPQTADYDFNVHVMDFLPGEHLNVKEVHYNQHGLLLLQGKGIYRCAASATAAGWTGQRAVQPQPTCTVCSAPVQAGQRLVSGAGGRCHLVSCSLKPRVGGQRLVPSGPRM